jgi:hypothetical protein
MHYDKRVYIVLHRDYLTVYYIRVIEKVRSNMLRFEIFTAVTMKNGVFWDVTPCGYCNNRRFGGT